MHANAVFYLPNGWTRTLGALLLVLLLSLGVFFETWASIVEIWARAKTYTHGFVIAPISFWLIWSRRRYYLQLSPRVSYTALAWVVACGFMWLSADLSHILIIKQLAVVGMLVGGFWAVLGNAVAFSMSFPLLFLFFMVPMGEELIPSLVEFTTTFTVRLLRFTGLPVFREGNYFKLTSGSWSVAEACSGISYLIASVTLGFVFAYLNYSSYWKRGLFMAMSVFVPIIANGFRAYMIVMIGHLSDMTLAVGVDHLIYGGVFFGLVMLLLFYLGSFWRDPPFTPIAIADKSAIPQTAGQLWAAIALLSVAFGSWPPISGILLDKQGVFGLPAYVSNPSLDHWRRTDPQQWLWKPHFARATDDNMTFYSNGTHTVGLYYASFGKEVQGAELVNSENALFLPKWLHLAQTHTLPVVIDGAVMGKVNTSLIKGGERVILAMDWYQISGEIAVNRYWVKARQLIKRLTGDTSPELKAVLWIQSTDNDAVSAEQALNSFLADWIRQNKLLTTP